VIFINGLPLVVIELKNPANEQTDIWDAFNQLQTYKDEDQRPVQQQRGAGGQRWLDGAGGLAPTPSACCPGARSPTKMTVRLQLELETVVRGLRRAVPGLHPLLRAVRAGRCA
jgi:type I restriction enzyme R subunit